MLQQSLEWFSHQLHSISLVSPDLLNCNLPYNYFAVFWFIFHAFNSSNSCKIHLIMEACTNSDYAVLYPPLIYWSLLLCGVHNVILWLLTLLFGWLIHPSCLFIKLIWLCSKLLPWSFLSTQNLSFLVRSDPLFVKFNKGREFMMHNFLFSRCFTKVSVVYLKKEKISCFTRWA